MLTFPGVQNLPEDLKQEIKEIREILEKFRADKRQTYTGSYIKNLVLYLKYDGTEIRIFYPDTLIGEVENYISQLFKKRKISRCDYQRL